MEGEWWKGYHEVQKCVWMWFEDGKLYGLYESGERKYEGEWKNGKPEGKGKYLNEEGEVMFEGEWKNGYYHVKASKWFSYMSGKVEKVIDLRKTRIPKCMRNKVSIEEIEDEETSKRRIWTTYGILGFPAILLVYMLYYLIFILRFNVIVSSEYRLNHICIFAISITVEEQFGNEMTGGLTFGGYPFLKSIKVKENSLQKVNSVVIDSLLIVD